VLTDVGGNREVQENGVTGLLVPAGNEVAFADALQKLAGNEDLRRQMGAAARKRTEAFYSRDAMIRRHLEIYRDVLRT
jgi:glycosyltransferase involved in cell wall biosynthesis